MTMLREPVRALLLERTPDPATCTVLACQAPHPVPRVRDRRHLAHCGTAAGVWTPTGRVIHGQAGREAEPEPGTILAWCHRCKAASEYRRVT